MNILAIDFGTKNIGLAWVDTAIGVVLPFGQIKIQNSKFKIDKVIVWLPMGLDGRENENTERVRKFAVELKQGITPPIEFVNEMFSSQQADRSEPGVSRDEKAAMIILESYLQAQNG